MVVMGESYAEGAGVKIGERFTAVLENKLRAEKRYNVVNMAITNASFNGQLELPKRKLFPRITSKWLCLLFFQQSITAAKPV